MKILFCDNSLREFLNFRRDVVKSYIERGDEVVVVAPRNSDIPSYLSGVKYYPIKLSRGGMNPLSDIKLMLNYLRIYRRESPDFIFHYTIKPNIYGTFAAKIAGIRSFAMVAGLGYVFTADGVGCKIARALYKTALSMSQKVLVLNRFNYQLLLDKGLSNSSKLILLEGGEGINLNEFDNQSISQ